MGLHESTEDTAELKAAKAELDEMGRVPGIFENKLAVRRWIYNAALAILAIAMTWRGIEAVTMEQWTVLLQSILQLGVFGAPILVARTNLTQRG